MTVLGKDQCMQRHEARETESSNSEECVLSASNGADEVKVSVGQVGRGSYRKGLVT